MADSERENLFRVAGEIKWSDRGQPANKKGYVKLYCPCGKHITWIHKTPSNPNHYRDRIAFMRRVCGDA